MITGQKSLYKFNISSKIRRINMTSVIERESLILKTPYQLAHPSYELCRIQQMLPQKVRKYLLDIESIKEEINELESQRLKIVGTSPSSRKRKIRKRRSSSFASQNKSLKFTRVYDTRSKSGNFSGKTTLQHGKEDPQRGYVSGASKREYWSEEECDALTHGFCQCLEGWRPATKKEILKVQQEYPVLADRSEMMTRVRFSNIYTGKIPFPQSRESISCGICIKLFN
ncbi:hypothetical protein QAD02_000512 [Eretmocerus hayati]|uniref:Uncharacterized protein n=1 Tax=Eretmocerus hayati TaxID=131215 RepID=A0ACC2NE84_9HYME|nr:hypothetical protein QAD02_000512 [Eretmocerus hayati]